MNGNVKIQVRPDVGQLFLLAKPLQSSSGGAVRIL